MRSYHEFVEFTTTTLNLDQQNAQRFASNFYKEFGGDRFYISKMDHRNKEIRDAFNGRNYQELARQFGLSERRIREIVA